MKDADERTDGVKVSRRWLGWAIGGAVGVGLLGGAAAIAIGITQDPGVAVTPAPLDSAAGDTRGPDGAPSTTDGAPSTGGAWAPATGIDLPATSEVVPVDATGDVGVWKVSFGTTDPDAIDAVAAGDAPYHDELGPGDVLVLATVTVTNGGNQPLDPAVDLLTGYLGANGTEYDVLRGQFCMAEGSLYDVGRLAPGERATGTVCQGMPREAVEGGAWVMRPADDYGGQVLFAPR